MEFKALKGLGSKVLLALAASPLLVACNQTAHTTCSAGTTCATEKTVCTASTTGYVKIEKEKAVWVFMANDATLEDFKAGKELAKHVTKMKNQDGEIKIYKAPDSDTLKGYLAMKPGFVTRVQEGYLWVYKLGSEELVKALKGEELAKHTTSMKNVNGQIITFKAPSKEVIDGYLAQ